MSLKILTFFISDRFMWWNVLTFASETWTAWSGRMASSGVSSLMSHSDRQALSPWSSLFTSTLMDVLLPAPLLSDIQKTRGQQGIPKWLKESKVTLLPSRGMQLQTHPNAQTGPTCTYSTDLRHLSPAPLFLHGEPTHYLGSNVWNAVLLGIWTTCFPAAAKIMTTRNVDY